MLLSTLHARVLEVTLVAVVGVGDVLGIGARNGTASVLVEPELNRPTTSGPLLRSLTNTLVVGGFRRATSRLTCLCTNTISIPLLPAHLMAWRSLVNDDLPRGPKPNAALTSTFGVGAHQ